MAKIEHLKYYKLNSKIHKSQLLDNVEKVIETRGFGTQGEFLFLNKQALAALPIPQERRAQALPELSTPKP